MIVRENATVYTIQGEREAFSASSARVFDFL